MSTGCECSIFEHKPGQWFYLLEHTHAPKNSWDWREHASCWGPFASEDQATDHLDRNHANPGGYSVDNWDASHAPDELEAKMVAEARR